MKIMFTIIFCLVLSLSTVVMPQDSTKHNKAFVTIEIGSTFLTDSSFGGTGFNIADDAKTVQIAFNFPLAKNLWLATTLTQSHAPAAGANLLKYTASGLELIYSVARRWEVLLNGEYAVIEMNGVGNWFNALGAVRYWPIAPLGYVQLGVYVIDGSATVSFRTGVRINM